MPVSDEIIIETVKKITTDFEPVSFRNQLTIFIPKDKLIEVAQMLRDNSVTDFDMLTDISAIDKLTPEDRFEVVYFLYSNKNKTRLRLKVKVQEENPSVPTLVDIWESANWYERETFDMYGIKFENHPDLRRLYMPEDYVVPETGEPIYPLRKDFPLMGIPGSLQMPPYPEKYGEPK
ncbi:MAG: NADH-quinone oxidoreductase subunit C [Bacteroidota bacterium]